MLILKKYRWWESETIQITGNYWYKEKSIQPNELAKIIESHIESDTLSELPFFLTGTFSIIIKWDQKYSIITDAIGRYPLFYIKAPNGIIISDQPQSLPFDRAIKKEEGMDIFFMHFGATSGKQTLIKGIHQTEAGSILELSIQEIQTQYYFIDQLLEPPKFEHTQNETQQLLYSIFEKQLPSDKNRQIILPLTSGYDSRLIAIMLKKFGFRNVLCCTWGRKNNPEMQVAQEIASKLGFEYLFVEYNKAIIENYVHDPHFLQWVKYTSHYTSMPYLQDYFAIKHLVQLKKIAPDAIAIPGHSGDTYTGEHLSLGIKTANHDAIANYIFSRFSNTKIRSRKEKEQVLQQIKATPAEKKLSPIGFFDYWDLSIRQSKLVANSTLIFDYFGIENLLPLSDQQFIQYFLTAPFEKRLNQKLYIQTLDEWIFAPYQLNIYPKKVFSPKKNHFKRILKKMAPKIIRVRYYKKKDIIYYQELTAVLKKEIKQNNLRSPKYDYQYNSYLIQWYLHFLLGNDKKLLL